MAILDTKDLKNRASALASAYPRECRKLVMIYTGVIAVLSLGSPALQMALDAQIGASGGLSGLQTRTILETIQEILSYVNMFFGPYWSAGFLVAMMHLTREQAPAPGDLLAGFKRFFAVLSHVGFELMVTIMMMFGIMTLAELIFSMTPWGAELSALQESVQANQELILADGTIDLTQLPLDAIIDVYAPLMVIFTVLFVPAYVYVSYGFRMALYLLMDHRMSAFQAHVLSVHLMRGHKWQMVKLDLSFWWYYLLGAVISVVAYLDVILVMLGITLPIDSMVMFFGTLIAYCALSFGLYLWKKCQVDAAYVLAFEAITAEARSQAEAEQHPAEQ